MATAPVDFRKGHDGLTAMVQSVLRKDPFTQCRYGFESFETAFTTSSLELQKELARSGSAVQIAMASGGGIHAINRASRLHETKLCGRRNISAGHSGETGAVATAEAVSKRRCTV
ncbi:IS66 family insertion sequence element accessory protein TnpB [Antarcticimicrobium sediminis]|uniref:IS66 family insertion sequence element accessory protein TnpB n=1 Tax=Antarcticimicrobium sediminis TaxID=2546227 RepID=UPI00247AB07E|nr:IS66 family insertion sequence element accessory protein TnpB [Antarcticimicrobium sediminis]